jgi:hypothetical protein
VTENSTAPSSTDAPKTWHYTLPNQPDVWRYTLSSISGEGWGIFLLTGDAFFATVSDYGNYAFQWRAIGPDDFRVFLSQVGSDYLLSKLSPGRTYDGSLTEQAVRCLIRSHLEETRIDEDDEKRELALLRKHSNLENEHNFHEWSEETALEHEPGELYETSHPSDVEAFCAKLFPRLQAEIRSQLLTERSTRAG